MATTKIMYKIMSNDSMSAIDGIQNSKQNLFIVNKIYSTMEEAFKHKVIFSVPSHIRILENEMADSLAQDTCR